MARYSFGKFSGRRLIRLIALFKLAKATGLLIAGLAVLRLVDKDVGAELERVVTLLGLDPDRRLIAHVIEYATNIPPSRIRQLGIVSFIYSGLYLTQGIGLWMRKRWAEWFTVIVSSSIVPLEVWELYLRPTALKALVLVVNLAVVAYLLYHIKQERKAEAHNPLETGDEGMVMDE